MSRVQNRNTLKDQFYTSEHVVKQCVQDIKQHVNTQNLWLLDSSCGNNYFAHLMGLPHISIDIEPKDCYRSNKTIDLIQGDFLQQNIKLPNKEFIMGFNPPFGLRNALAKQFIKKLYKYNPKYLALILLNNKNWNFPGYKTIIAKQLPKDCFVLNDKPKDVPCTFFLLEREQDNNENDDKKTPKFLLKDEHYKLKTDKCVVKRGKTDAPSNYSIAVRYVGAYAGNQYYIFYEGHTFYIDYMKQESLHLNETKHKISNVFTLIHFKNKTDLTELYRIVHEIYMKSHEYIDKTAIRANFNTNNVKKIIDSILN